MTLNAAQTNIVQRV